MHVGLATKRLNGQLIPAKVFLVRHMKWLMNITYKVEEQSHGKKALFLGAFWILQDVSVLIDGRNNLLPVRTITIHVQALCAARNIDVVERLDPVILGVASHLVRPHCSVSNRFIAKDLAQFPGGFFGKACSGNGGNDLVTVIAPTEARRHSSQSKEDGSKRALHCRRVRQTHHGATTSARVR